MEPAVEISQLEQELASVREVIARIDAALARIDPDDLDRLTDEGGRRAIMIRRQREIEAELAHLRAPVASEPAARECTRLVGDVVFNSIALLPDGSSLLTGGSDGLALRDAASGAVQRVYDLTAGRLSVAVSSDGRYVAGRHYDVGAVVFERQTGQRVRHFPYARTPANIAFVRPNYHLAAVRNNSRKQVTIDRVGGNGQRVVGYGFPGEITLLAFPDHGRALLAVGGFRCLLFGMEDGVPDNDPNIGGGDITAVAFAPGGTLMLLGHEEGQLGLGVLEEPDHDRFRFRLTHLIPAAGRGRVYDVDFTPDGRFFAVRRAQSVELYRREEGQVPTVIATYNGVGGVDPVARRSLLIAPDGRSFVTAGYEGLYRGDL